MAHVPVVAEMMTPDPITLSPHDRVGKAIRLMKESSIRHLPLVEEGVLVGLVSQRDLLACDDGRRSLSELMATELKTVTRQTLAWEAAYLLLRHRIGCLPVVAEGGRLEGIVTESDFVRVAYSLLGGEVPIDELMLEERV